MNDYSAFYKTQTQHLDGFVVQEVKITNKLFRGLMAIAEAEEQSIEEVIMECVMNSKSCFENPNYNSKD